MRYPKRFFKIYKKDLDEPKVKAFAKRLVQSLIGDTNIKQFERGYDKSFTIEISGWLEVFIKE